MNDSHKRRNPGQRLLRPLTFARLVLLSAVAIAGPDVSLAVPPNVLLIVSEDNGPELGCYGDRYANTPHLDRLAEQGTRFTRAFVAQAGCSQSRASLLTGLYPHQHGQIGLATWGFRLFHEQIPNLPRSLKAAGYRTGILGKLHINPESAFPFDFQEIPGANFARKNLGDYARHAESFMSTSQEPFFLSVNYPDAHDPFVPQVDGLPREPLTGDDVECLSYFGIDPPQLRTPIANYYNCLARLDSCVGELLEALDRTGKSDNTIIIYLGDHGADLLRGKRTSYEGGVRIPLLIRWPGMASGQVRDELVSTIDLMPTLLEACGAAPLQNLPGRSLQPLLEGKQVAWRSHLFTEYHTHATRANFFPQRTVRNERFKLIENLLPGEINPDFESKVSKDHPYILPAIAKAPSAVQGAYARMQRPPRYELYDLDADPHEFVDLADSSEHVAVLSDLKQHLHAWREQTNDPLLNESALQQLKTEVLSVKNKSQGKRHVWGYPDYFFSTPSPDTSGESKSDRAASP